MDNPRKTKQARLLAERRARRRKALPDVDAPIALPSDLEGFRAPPFSVLVCAGCGASWRFDGEGRALGSEIRSRCECGSNQVIIRRITAPPT